MFEATSSILKWFISRTIYLNYQYTNWVRRSPRKHDMSVLQITRQCVSIFSLYCRCCPDFKAPRGMVQLSELLPLELEQHRCWTNAGPCRGPHSQRASSRPTHGSLPQPEGVVQPIVHHGQWWQLFDNCLCGWSAYTHSEADGRRVSGEFSEGDLSTLPAVPPSSIVPLRKNSRSGGCVHSLPRPVNSFWKLARDFFANISTKVCLGGYGALCMISLDSVANFNSHAVSIAGDNSLLVSFPDHLGTRLGTRLERLRTLYVITLDSVARLPSTLHAVSTAWDHLGWWTRGCSLHPRLNQVLEVPPVFELAIQWEPSEEHHCCQQPVGYPSGRRLHDWEWQVRL